MKQQLSGCKPVQMTELEADFEKLKGEKKAKPTKLLRSQQQIVASPEDEGDGAGEGTKGGEADEEEADDDTDPYDLMDPVDILEKLPKNFYELVNTFDYPESQIPVIETHLGGLFIRNLSKLTLICPDIESPTTNTKKVSTLAYLKMSQYLEIPDCFSR